jgi:hypothetical protein
MNFYKNLSVNCLNRFTLIAKWFALVCCLFSATVSAAPVVSIGSATVQVGNTFEIPVSINGLDDLMGLISWQFDLRFDSSIIGAVSVNEGPFLSSFGTTFFSPGVIDNGAGLISLMTDSYVDLALPSGSGVLATITFSALGIGSSALTPGNVFLNFADSGFIVSGGNVTVDGATSVPEPNTLLLVLFAELLLWVSAARRTRPL